jgi:hypothetical protein
MEKESESFVRRITVFVCVALFGSLIAASFLGESVNVAAAKTTIPKAHMIAGVPWHQQLNGLSCGAASLEITYDYWGPDVDQKEIMNVARTSSMGTWTPDIVRAGHFSYLSNAQGNFFPAAGPLGGYEERHLGYAAFSHTSSEFWLNELKTLVANDIPVIVLMKYYPWGGGGHYRVVIGYDDDQQLIYFSDPWGRDLNHLTDWTGVISWSYSDFQMGWDYCEYGVMEPYFGAVAMPWSIDVSVKGEATAGSVIDVAVSVEYPCPEPFDETQYPAQNTTLQIAVPEGMTLLRGSSTVSIGTLSSASTTRITWKLLCDEDATGKEIRVSAWGIISGWVPEAHWNGQAVYYPAYSYVDAIGGEITVTL